ncbi:IDEAL domain-containing protein [Alicyclobacillus macrosporangiidus]|uniref:IDEAL domain-containing protein n=1 Tax=Alicyclobacillus macrosporangiidus TaxID=392015 RepID=UPI0004984C16|nr:IDEAL domain-containing protein [Alicyclobacillus macrosporangiidus]MCL6600217.1 IDEAL domain-containing protein [Alicyclobacillus macrosporangiidus]
MVAREELLLLKTKILPAGADAIVDFLASHHQQIEMTHIVLENVPLLIIGRHGMIARIPSGGTMHKISQPNEILEHLKQYLNKQETLYLFINLPDLPLPREVTQVLEEVIRRDARKLELRRTIDEALEKRDRELFYKASRELNALLAESYDSTNTHNRGLF